MIEKKNLINQHRAFVTFSKLWYEIEFSAVSEVKKRSLGALEEV